MVDVKHYVCDIFKGCYAIYGLGMSLVAHTDEDQQLVALTVQNMIQCMREVACHQLHAFSMKVRTLNLCVTVLGTFATTVLCYYGTFKTHLRCRWHHRYA